MSSATGSDVPKGIHGLLADDRSVPSDNTTLTEVIAGYHAAGFVGDFWSERDANVRCGSCESVLAARRLTVHSIRRLEGASDPADMLAVAAATCSACGARGTMVLTFGPMGSAEDADVLAAFTDRRDDDVLPADSSPAEQPGDPV